MVNLCYFNFVLTGKKKQKKYIEKEKLSTCLIEEKPYKEFTDLLV